MELETLQEEQTQRPGRGRRRGIIFLIVLIVIALVYLFFSDLGQGLSGLTPRNTIPYEEMEYTRPDSEDILRRIEDHIYSIANNVDSYDDQLEYLYEFNQDYTDVNSMYVLAMIKGSQDVTDEKFVEENDFFAEFLPVLSQKTEELLVACAQSKHREEFERDFWGQDYLEDYRDGTTITDTSVELTQQTEELSNEFLISSANPTIEYKGAEYPFYDLLTSGNLAEEDYYAVIKAYYEQYNPIFGEMYVQIVKDNMMSAKEQGYDSYIDYAYDSYMRDYTPDDAEELMDSIKTHLVPLYKRLVEDGIYGKRYDGFICDDEDMASALEYVTASMGGRLETIYEYMVRYGLYDFKMSDVKEHQSYTVYIDKYDAPFILVDPAGDDTDILTAIHEFGHFTDKYINYGYSMGVDSDEIASQALEYLSLFHMDGFLHEDDAELIRSKKLIDTAEVFVYQGYLSQLETEVYSLDYEDVTLENINAIAARCAEEFGLAADEPYPGYYSLSWCDIPHLYDAPMYVLGYCTSCGAAFQFYELGSENPKKALDTYFELINWDLNGTFSENLQRVGLESPFEEGCVERIGRTLEEYFYN